MWIDLAYIVINIGAEIEDFSTNYKNKLILYFFLNVEYVEKI